VTESQWSERRHGPKVPSFEDNSESSYYSQEEDEDGDEIGQFQKDSPSQPVR